MRLKHQLVTTSGGSSQQLLVGHKCVTGGAQAIKLGHTYINEVGHRPSGVARGGPAGARPRLAQLRPRLSKLGWGPPPQYFNIWPPLKSCNGGTTPVMECIVQTHFVSNGYLYITALLMFDHCFVISQHMYSDIFSSFLLIYNK